MYSYSIAKQIEDAGKIGNYATVDESIIETIIRVSYDIENDLSIKDSAMSGWTFNEDKEILADLLGKKIQEVANLMVHKLSLIEEHVQRKQKLLIDGIEEDDNHDEDVPTVLDIESDIYQLKSELNSFFLELGKLASK